MTEFSEIYKQVKSYNDTYKENMSKIKKLAEKAKEEI